MPELPEVETVRRGLSKVLDGRRIVAVDQRRPDLRYPLPPRFAARVRGRRVERLGRRGKYLLLTLAGGETLIAHLGMSGRMLVTDLSHQPAAHDHVILETEDGVRVVYNDARRFGFMDLAATDDLDTHKHLAGMGPEPLSASFTPTALANALDGKQASIKAALLDQRIVAGLGNIYVCESLHRARLSPLRKAGTVTGPRSSERLVSAIRDVLTAAIAAGGSSLRDYRQANGELGYFQHAWTVYGREGEICGSCPAGLDTPARIHRLVQSNRSTFYCPRCQR